MFREAEIASKNQTHVNVVLQDKIQQLFRYTNDHISDYFNGYPITVEIFW